MGYELLRRAAAVGLVSGLLAGGARAAVPTDAELAAFGKKVQQAIAEQNAAAYGALWNADALIERVTGRVDAPATLKNDVAQGIKETLSKQLPQTIIDAAGASGGMKYLSLRKVDGATRVVLRVTGASGLNYQELIVEPDAAGELKMTDMFVYVSGENFSQTLRRLYLQAAVQAGKGGGGMPPGFATMSTMQQQVKAGDFKGAIATYDAAPAEAKKQRVIQILRITAAAKGDQTAYMKVLDEYGQLFNGDATADLIALDSLFIQKNWDAVRAAVDRLEKQTGRDPYLDIYRANASITGGEIDKGKAVAARGLAEEPQLLELADILLTQALAEKDYPTVKKYMLHIEQNTPRFRFGDIKAAPGWEGFAASPQYAEWEKERK